MTSISYISSTSSSIGPNNKHVPGGKGALRNPADLFLGQPVINFIETKYGNVVPYLQKNYDDLFLNLRIYLMFGRLIGLVPISGVFQRDFKKLKCSKTSWPAIVTFLIALLLSANAVVGIVSMGAGGVSKADQYAHAPAMFIFYGTGTYLFVYFYRHSQELLNLITKWNNLQLYFTKPDVTLFRNVNAIAGFVLTSAILENAVGHLKLFPLVPKSESHDTTTIKENPNASPWEIYYLRSHGQWANLVPFNMPIALYVFISNKLALYAWNYMDILITLLSRALYFKFKVLYTEADVVIFSGRNFTDASKWRQLTKDHDALCNMVQDITKLLSPLIFISYGNNIYYICLQLNLGLNPSANTSTVASVYALWSFLHLIARVYIVSIAGARVNDWAHKANELFRKCPNEAYITEVERTERFISGNVIALSGLGCFVITKPLILQIVGVVFTFEIVLLQASQTTVQ